MTYDGALTCVDLGPQVPAPCGPATSMARVTGTWTGQLQLPRLAISFTRVGTWTLSGLQTATVTVDGTSHTDLTSLFASASDQNHKQLVLASDAIYQAISVDRVSHLPVGGDIQYAITGERTHTTPGLDATQPFSADAILIFGADHTATLVIDGDQQFVIDLETVEARRGARLTRGQDRGRSDPGLILGRIPFGVEVPCSVPGYRPDLGQAGQAWPSFGHATS